MPAYLNACSRGLPTKRMLDAMAAHLQAEATLTPRAVAARRAEIDAQARAKAATLLGASVAAVGFSSSTYAAWMAIVSQLPLTGRRVLVAPHEWGADVRFLQRLARHGAVAIETLPPLDPIAPDLSGWAARIDDDVAAIVAPFVTSVDGLRYPVEAIGRLDRPAGCRLILDAAQALGQTPIDVATLGCDALVATCRKWLRGPRASALFWLSDSLRDDLAVAAIEPYDFATHQRLGVALAIEDAQAHGVARIEAAIRALMTQAAARAAMIGLEATSGVPPQSGALTLGIPEAAIGAVENAMSAAAFDVAFPDRAGFEPLAPSDPPGTRLMRLSAHRDSDPAALDACFDALAAAL